MKYTVQSIGENSRLITPLHKFYTHLESITTKIDIAHT